MPTAEVTPAAVDVTTRAIRLIARLDIKMDFLIKGVHLEGWRKVGDPGEYARRYYRDGADELLYMDVVASLYERNNLVEIVRHVARDVLIPITVGGGVRTVADVKELLGAGADKVAINTAATRDPNLLRMVSDSYGSQATVLSIEAKSRPHGGWEAMTDNGRNHTGRDAVAWAAEGASMGAGEILITSIDRDGTRRGLDVKLIGAVAREVDIPVIACGGAGTPEHVLDAVSGGGASAVAMAKGLHDGTLRLGDVRTTLRSAGYRVRTLEEESP